jgi:Stage II sporulation protein E (SpoIIE)/GAF domain/PAS fold
VAGVEEAPVAAASSDRHAGRTAAVLADLASFTLEPGGLITSWSDAAARMFGRAAEQAVGAHVQSLLADGHEAALGSALAAAAAGTSWSGSMPAACAGGPRPLSFRWDPLRGPANPHVAVVVHSSPPGAEVIADVGTQLGASLDLTETARQVLELAVPGFADAGAVYLLDALLPAAPGGGGEAVARRLAVQPETRALPPPVSAPAGDVVIFPPGSPPARCVAAGRPVVFGSPDADLPSELPRWRLNSTDVFHGYASFLVAPLTARGEATGLLLLARRPGTPAFGPADLAPAEALTARAGVCVDNARLFTQERRSAEALQQGLLPRALAAPAGLDVAHHYRPAGDNVIGGDWYDVIALPHGRWAIAVGDAMGHGPEAAALMAQLRAATHVLADLDLSPDELLYRLNRMAMTVTDGTFATCVCATLDPASGTCVLARAGHLPPVVALPDGTCDVVDLPPGLPLGLGDADFYAVRLDLPPGAMLALYTDGLVENRSRTFEDGIGELRTALTAARGPLTAACDTIASALSTHGEDDTTLVLARLPAGPASG